LSSPSLEERRERIKTDLFIRVVNLYSSGFVLEWGHMNQETKKRPIPFVRKLCAHLSEEWIEAAEERLRKYIRIGLKIHEQRIKEGMSAQPESRVKTRDKNPIKVVITRPKKKTC